jgi:hypothetical protein
MFRASLSHRSFLLQLRIAPGTAADRLAQGVCAHWGANLSHTRCEANPEWSRRRCQWKDCQRRGSRCAPSSEGHTDDRLYREDISCGPLEYACPLHGTKVESCGRSSCRATDSATARYAHAIWFHLCCRHRFSSAKHPGSPKQDKERRGCGTTNLDRGNDHLSREWPALLPDRIPPT